jgi:ATP-dependent DNA ligase
MKINWVQTIPGKSWNTLLHLYGVRHGFNIGLVIQALSPSCVALTVEAWKWTGNWVERCRNEAVPLGRADQVRFTEWTRDDRLRQPVFLGIREDKNAIEVVREKAALRQ